MLAEVSAILADLPQVRPVGTDDGDAHTARRDRSEAESRPLSEEVDREVFGWGRGFTLVGRERELALLRAALIRPPAVVLVEGEAGVGKSRLVYEAAETLSERGIRVLTGFCHQLREPFPFGPVLEALRTVGDWLPAPASLSPQAGALAPLLPELADRLPDVPAVPEDARAARFQLVGAVRAVLDALGPAVLVVEDLHWVDEATRDLLLLLARDLPRHLALVLTYRREDLPAGSGALGAPYHRPVGTGGVEIHVDPLTFPDVLDLAASALGPRATPAVSRTLFERSGGLPLIAEEDLLALTDPTRPRHFDAGAPAPGPDDVALLASREVPRGLREAVTARMAGLSACASALVEAAAVLAVPAERPVLAAVAGLDVDRATEALIEALQAVMLAERAPTLYGFRHVLAQQAVYRAIPGPRREDLHHRALEVLRGQTRAPLVQIAHHTRALGDVAQWLSAAEAAADQAIALRDEGTAAALLREILDQPRLEPDVRTRNALALARIAVLSADYPASLAALRRILTDPLLPAPARGEIRLTLGLLLGNTANDQVGVSRELTRAVDELETRPDLASRAMIALAVIHSDRPEQAWEWMERAERTVRESPDQAARAAVNASRLTLLAGRGDPTVWHEAEQLPRDADDPQVLMQTLRALMNIGAFAIELGHDERAADLTAESQSLARQLGNSAFQAIAQGQLLDLDYQAGRWAGLEERYISLATEFPAMTGLSTYGLLNRGNLAVARGQWSRGLNLLQQAAAEWETQGGHVIAAKTATAAAIARLRLAQDDAPAAYAILDPILEPLRQAALWPRACDIVSVIVKAALAVGKETLARDLVAQAEKGLIGADAPAAIADLHLARGILLLHDGHTAEAADHFDRARVIFQAIGRPHAVAHSTEHCALAHLSGQPLLAAGELTHAAEAYTHLGATAEAARCQRAQRDLGLARPKPRGRRGYGRQLSPREVEVARLLAGSATNQDIAHALALSPRTVEHHVTNILKKLGKTREELQSTSFSEPDGRW